MKLKYDELKVTICTFNVDIFLITETWLNPLIPSNIFEINEYKMLRNDRENRIGGGVCIYIKNTVKFNFINFIHKPEFVESIILNLIETKVLLIAIYIPPNLSKQMVNELNDIVTELIDKFLIQHPEHSVIFAGDINKFNVSNLCSNYDLSETIHENTRNNAILDQILMSNNIITEYESPTISAPISTSDHNSIIISPKHSSKTVRCAFKMVYDFRQSNINRFLEILSKTNWTEIYFPQNEDIDIKVDKFKCKFHEAFKTIPRKAVPIKINDKNWVTPLIKNLIHCRWNAFRKGNMQIYNHLKTKIKHEINKSKVLWSQKLLHDNKNRPWKIFNHITNKTKNKDDMNQLIELLLNNGISNPANTINKHFFKNFNTDHTDNKIEIADDGWNILITEYEVFEQLSKLDDSKSCGPENIPPKLYRLSVEFIYKPLTHIFNTLIHQRKYPTDWKIAKVIPIPKKPNPSIEDIRPISILNTFSKIFEKLLIKNIKQTMTENYGKHQYGFKCKSSTTCALIHMHDQVTKILDKKENVSASILAFDLSKAFDRVPHSKLINSLLSTNIPKGLIKIFNSYLTNRYQYVESYNFTSNKIKVISGVPQGGCLSPSLFCIYARNLEVNTQESILIKFADDSTVILEHKSIDEEECDIQSIKTQFKQSSQRLSLPLNLDKTQILTIRKYRNSRPHTTIKILGVTFNSKLTWTDHIDIITKRANRNLYPLRKLKPILCKNNLVNIYNATIRNIFEYSCPLFIGLHNKDLIPLKKVEKRAMQIIYFPDDIPECRTNITTRIQKLGINLYKKAATDKEHALHHLIPPILPRSHQHRQPPSNSDRRLRAFIPFTTQVINSM